MQSEHLPFTPSLGKPGTGTRCPVPPTTPGKPGTPTTPGVPGAPVTPGSPVTTGAFNTGQKAKKEKADQYLDWSELPVLNSPTRWVQLEHNVHEPLGNMPTLLTEHSSEHSQIFQDLTNSDSPYDRADKSPERSHLRHSGHWSSGISHTGNPLGIGHTGNHPDHEHSVHRSRSVPSDAREHGSNRTRHRSDVSRSSRRDRNTYCESIPLRHADPGQHSPASLLRHRCARSRSRSYDSVSPRRHSRSPSRSRGKKKKSHKKRKHSSTSSASSCRSSSSSSREREIKRHKSKKKSKKHSKSRSSKRDKHEKKKHKRKRSPSLSPSSSSSSFSLDSSSSLQRSPARKRSRANSRSPSAAVDNPLSASRTVSPVSHRDHISLHADNDDKFNSHSEDNQDSAPDVETQDVSETQSNVSTEDMRFHNLVEEVFKLLPVVNVP